MSLSQLKDALAVAMRIALFVYIVAQIIRTVRH